MESFTDLATAAYCPRKLYYRRKNDDATPPDDVAATRNLAFRYPSLLEAETPLDEEPIVPDPSTYRDTLGRQRRRLDRWSELVSPASTRTFLSGKDAHGIAHKLLESPAVPVIVSTGTPPDCGIWEPHGVRATAAAKALSWERQQPVETAYVEYPAYGVIRKVDMTTRRKATYRKTLRIAESLDGPPPRLDSDERCRACEYADECGTKTRSLRSRLSLSR